MTEEASRTSGRHVDFTAGDRDVHPPVLDPRRSPQPMMRGPGAGHCAGRWVFRLDRYFPAATDFTLFACRVPAFSSRVVSQLEEWGNTAVVSE